MKRSPVFRLLGLLPLALLAACIGNASQDPPLHIPLGQEPETVAGLHCRIAANGGPPVRSGQAMADRGIGGTGAPALPLVADRGIGGTGITGVITGFASICVDGLRVAYDDTAAVDIDGSAAPASALRVGQLVTIIAEGPPTALRASAVSVRSEVAGRIESVRAGAGTMTVGGQEIIVPKQAWGVHRFGLGDWVSVSGLRRHDGIIIASRLDPATPGHLSVRGEVIRDDGVTRVGKLALPAALAAQVKPGDHVRISGSYAGNEPAAAAVAPDRQCPTLAECFGPSVRHVVAEAFIHPENGRIWLNGLPVPLAPGAVLGKGFRMPKGAAGVAAGANAVSGAAASSHVGGAAGKHQPDHIAIISLDRKPDGSYVATGLRYADTRPVPVIAGQPGRARLAAVVPPRGRPAASMAVPASLTPAVDSSEPDAAGVPATEGDPVSVVPPVPPSDEPAAESATATAKEAAAGTSSAAPMEPASGLSTEPMPGPVGAPAPGPVAEPMVGPVAVPVPNSVAEPMLSPVVAPVPTSATTNGPAEIPVQDRPGTASNVPISSAAPTGLPAASPGSPSTLPPGSPPGALPTEQRIASTAKPVRVAKLHVRHSPGARPSVAITTIVESVTTASPVPAAPSGGAAGARASGSATTPPLSARTKPAGSSTGWPARTK